MTNRTLVSVRVGVRTWIKIYIRVLRTWNYYQKSSDSGLMREGKKLNMAEKEDLEIQMNEVVYKIESHLHT